MTDATTPANPADELAQSLRDLIRESEALRTDVKSAEATRRREQRINLAAMCVMAIFIGLILLLAGQNIRLSQQVKQTNDRIAGCTTAGGACYEEGKQRTGQVIADIVRAEVYVAECARQWPGESGPAFDTKMERCVADRLKNGR